MNPHTETYQQILDALSNSSEEPLTTVCTIANQNGLASPIVVTLGASIVLGFPTPWGWNAYRLGGTTGLSFLGHVSIDEDTVDGDEAPIEIIEELLQAFTNIG